MKEYKYKVKGAEYTVKINDVEGNIDVYKRQDDGRESILFK